jgi:hypothetical protein
MTFLGAFFDKFRVQSKLTRNMQKLNKIGSNVRIVRGWRGMTVRVLAAKLQCAGLNLSRGSLYALEGRTRCITDYEVCLISRALGVHLECLFMSTADLSAYLLNRRPKRDLIAESPLES